MYSRHLYVTKVNMTEYIKHEGFFVWFSVSALNMTNALHVPYPAH